MGNRVRSSLGICYAANLPIRNRSGIVAPPGGFP